LDVESITAEYLRQKGLLGGDVELSRDTNPLQGGLVDSLGIFTLIAFLEQQFGVQIEPDEVTLENFETIGTIADLVRRKQEGERKSA
jgi:acyl carrier protein